MDAARLGHTLAGGLASGARDAHLGDGAFELDGLEDACVDVALATPLVAGGDALRALDVGGRPLHAARPPASLPNGGGVCFPKLWSAPAPQHVRAPQPQTPRARLR